MSSSKTRLNVCPHWTPPLSLSRIKRDVKDDGRIEDLPVLLTPPDKTKCKGCENWRSSHLYSRSFAPSLSSSLVNCSFTQKQYWILSVYMVLSKDHNIITNRKNGLPHEDNCTLLQKRRVKINKEGLGRRCQLIPTNPPIWIMIECEEKGLPQQY